MKATQSILISTVTVVLSLTIGLAQASAQFQPKVIDIPPKPAAGVALVRIVPSSIRDLKDQVELLEAQRDVKKAYVKAAEIGVTSAEKTLARLAKLTANDVASAEDVAQAGVKLEEAKAQLDIRTTELREVEVRLKHANRRLNEGGASTLKLLESQAAELDAAMKWLKMGAGEKPAPTPIPAPKPSSK